MPNWCSNNLKLTHQDPAQIDRVITAFTAERLFSEFVPRPPEEEDNWYSWNTANWGTKWDCGDKHADVDNSDPNTVELSFDSAWAPPVEFYRQLSEQGFTVHATYYEPGMGFVGEYTTEGDDDYYEISGDSAWVRDNIPEHLDEEWCISEFMSEDEVEGDIADIDQDEEEQS